MTTRQSLRSDKKGVTLVELVIVISVVGILASAFSAIMIPTMNFFFYYPQSSRVNNAAADVLQIITEGDEKAKGLRFTGRPCAPSPWLTGTVYNVNDYVFQNNLIYICLVGHTAGTFATDLGAGDWTTDAITTATASTLTYRYALSDACGTTNSYSVALVYNSGSHTVTRSINGGTAVEIPYYATAASGIKIDPPAATNFFRYYNAAGTELGAGFTAADRVDITVSATSGTGAVNNAAGQILMKAAAEIKKYTT